MTPFKLFDLFDSESLGDVDLREFLLSMLNFVTVDKEVRIRFSFQMYDEGKSGFITQKEIEEILRGNHMIGIASVQRKAETIMKQAVSNKTGSITINEFVVVSKKFPNILLPVLDVKK
jgi:serine/threonine-protein phosphatase 2B regulatory subunit